MQLGATTRELRDKVIGHSLGMDFKSLVASTEHCTDVRSEVEQIILTIRTELSEIYGLNADDPESWRNLNLALVERYSGFLSTLHNLIKRELGEDFFIQTA